KPNGIAAKIDREGRSVAEGDEISNLKRNKICTYLFVYCKKIFSIKIFVMEKIKWGIIGCGDVTEVKSGPAFNKVENSELFAVMRRDAEKAKDYAQRHNVPKWYSDAKQLIH